jgi:predicted 2-oxoglutarate/Fe(II)-dependent dioxygenase YbiX
MSEYQWISDDIFTVSGFCGDSECDGYIQLGESLGFGDAPINTFFGPGMAKDVRNNSRVLLDDPGRAQLIWERARLYVPERLGGHRALGLNERFRFYRYDPGQTFRWHRDGYFQRSNGERSRLTFMIYLNDDFEGGETRFERATVRPVKGMALFFDHPMLHEGAEVKRGRKYVLRTDVMYSG